ncbi:MAG: heavy-metal-associated domain-containing protein [Thermodesulfovibrionales bacterium]|nr:heavy-metal-associated domain-containing protein [Thermodesulfovibrionales bacterium]
MEKISFNVAREFCDECSIALRRFIGNMEGVESIDVESGKIAISFNDSKIDEEKFRKITIESIEKLGYKIE